MRGIGCDFDQLRDGLVAVFKEGTDEERRWLIKPEVGEVEYARKASEIGETSKYMGEDEADSYMFMTFEMGKKRF